MRRNAAFMRGRTFAVLSAGLIGYLIGGWHPAALRAGSDASAADTVALRFPPAWTDASPAAASPTPVPGSGVLNNPGTTTAAAANTLSDAQLALLDPQPMIPEIQVPEIQVPQIQPQPVAQASQESASPQPVPQAPARLQLASAEMAAPPPAFDANPARRPQPREAMLARVQRPVKSATVERRPMNRPGYMLDDAQIASIKERLHLTPDQEQMWPAVEVALRNIAYTRAQQARSRTAPAEIDPESVEGLKSAAVPLIMSFDDDQKQQVRDLAHVMGLDQLASQF